MDTREEETWLATRMPFPQPLKEKMDAAVFIDASTGKLRHIDLIPASADQLQFSQCFWRAVESPSTNQAPYRPGVLVVDRGELERAVRSLARMQRIALHVDPSVGEFIRAPLNDMMSGMENLGFSYTYDEDVDPALVGQFFDRVHEFLEATPWERLKNEDVLVLKGLEVSPLFCLVMGAGGKPGLALCLNRQALEAVFSPDRNRATSHASLTFTLESEPGLALSEEIARYGWRVHWLGVPTLVRYDRHDRPNPTNRELKLACEALEAVLLFQDFHGVDLEARLSSGRDVSMTLDEGFGPEPEVILSVSLTPRQRDLLSLFLPYLKPGLELDKKRRRTVPVPLRDVELVEELVLNDSLRLLSSDKVAARGLRESLVKAAEEAGVDYQGLNPIPQLNDEQCKAYLDSLLEGFQRSPNFKANPRYIPFIGTFYELAYKEYGLLPQQVGRGVTYALLMKHLPGRTSLPPEESEVFVWQLCEFFRYVRLEHRFHYANECLQSIGGLGFDSSFRRNLADPPVRGRR